MKTHFPILFPVPLALVLVGLLAMASCTSPTDTKSPPSVQKGEVAVGIQTQANASQALSLSSTSVTVALGQAISLTPTFAGATDWRWYVNGDQVATTSSLSYTPTATGLYTISATVLYEGVLYSGSLTATVTAAN